MAGDETIKNYQLNAEKCPELAQTFKDLESKRVLVSMANAWLKLAGQHVKKTQTVLVTPTLRVKSSDDLK